MCGGGGGGPSGAEIERAAAEAATAERAKIEAEKALEKFKEEQTLLRRKTGEANRDALKRERQKRLTILGAAEEDDEGSSESVLGGY